MKAAYESSQVKIVLKLHPDMTYNMIMLVIYVSNTNVIFLSVCICEKRMKMYNVCVCVYAYECVGVCEKASVIAIKRAQKEKSNEENENRGKEKSM